jgi:hypothetical protein
MRSTAQRRLAEFAHLPYHPGDRVLCDDGEEAYIVDYGPVASDGWLTTAHYLLNRSEPEYDEPGTCFYMKVDQLEPVA